LLVAKSPVELVLNNMANKMETLAIVGSGISGISAAYYLKDHYDVHVFEKADYVGGHTNTISVSEGDREIGIDTAFMVFNRDNYLNLTKMFDELGVTTLKHEGGYNFFDRDHDFEYGTDELMLSEEEIKSKYPKSFQHIWSEANRFFSESGRHFFEGKTFVPLKQYLEENNYDAEFINSFVVQLGSACWSLPADKMAEMPASTLIGFFMNHGHSGLGGKKVSWETVEGGSRQYLEKIQNCLYNPVNLNSSVDCVRSVDGRQELTINNEIKTFDKVLLATHADTSLSLLAQPTPEQKSVLGKISYNSSEIVLHTDTSVLSKNSDRWSSWNYGNVCIEGVQTPYLVYFMNKIQGFNADKKYLVSVDSPLPIESNKIIKRMTMEHPIIDMHLYRSQKELNNLNENENIFFSGTYFSIKRAGPDFAGFHESGISSAISVVNKLIEIKESKLCKVS